MSTMTDSTLTYVASSREPWALDDIAAEVGRLYGAGACVVALGRLTTLYVDRRYPTAVPAWDYARELYDAALQGRSVYRAAIR
jgi:hypothetical protein